MEGQGDITVKKTGLAKLPFPKEYSTPPYSSLLLWLHWSMAFPQNSTFFASQLLLIPYLLLYNHLHNPLIKILPTFLEVSVFLARRSFFSCESGSCLCYAAISLTVLTKFSVSLRLDLCSSIKDLVWFSSPLLC